MTEPDEKHLPALKAHQVIQHRQTQHQTAAQPAERFDGIARTPCVHGETGAHIGHRCQYRDADHRPPLSARG